MDSEKVMRSWVAPMFCTAVMVGRFRSGVTERTASADVSLPMEFRAMHR